MSQSSPQSSKNGGLKVLFIVLGCLGCGGFGLFAIGIIAAIALPSFLNQAHQVKSSEASTYVGAITRGQQVYYLENQTFSSNIEDLGLGIGSATESYFYDMEVQPEGTSVIITAIPQDEDSLLISYTGAVFAVGDDPATMTTFSEVCESFDPIPPEPPVFNSETETVECGY